MTNLASGFLSVVRLQDRYEDASSRAGADGSSRLRMRHFSLCRIAPREPSRAGASTWRWHAQSEAALGADGFAFNTNRRGFQRASNGLERTCRPRLTRCVDGPASRSARQRPRRQDPGPNQAPHGVPGGADQPREEYEPCSRQTRANDRPQRSPLRPGIALGPRTIRSPIIAKKTSPLSAVPATYTCHSPLASLAMPPLCHSIRCPLPPGEGSQQINPGPLNFG